MKHHIKKSLEICLIILTFTLLAACGTTKNFVVDSNPKGALILLQHKESYTEGETPNFIQVERQGEKVISFIGETPIGETPITIPVTFFDNNTKVNFVAEKRGYASSTNLVTKDSEPSMLFELKRIDGVSGEVFFKKEHLQSGTFILLPAFVEVFIHSGIGSLDKTEYSSDVSTKVTEELNAELIKSLDRSGKQIRRVVLDETQGKDWPNLSLEINKYLLKLNAKRLPYYSLPPYVNSNVEGFALFISGLEKQLGSDTSYLLYIWAKCISETKGRKAGNIILGILGAAHTGAMRGMYGPGYTPPYDLSAAFNTDSGTLVVMYVIDAKTSEVVYIELRGFPDITDSDELKKMAGFVSKFPHIDKKPD